MKIAVLLFGHLRTFEYCAPYLKANLLDKYDCDVFMHTWDELDSHTKSWDNKHDIEGVLTDYHKQLINDFYHPKAIKIEHQKLKSEIIIKSKVDNKSGSLNGMRYMFHSMNEVNNLRKKYETETGTKYDIVIVTRPDVALFNPLEIQKTLSEAKLMNLDLNKCRFFAGLYGDANTNVRLIISRVSDILFFGKPNVIDKYIQVNCNISKAYAEKHFLNIVSVYTSNEINAGIIPVEICFAYSSDWENVKQYPVTIQKKHHSKIYKILHFYWLRGKK